MLRRDGRGVKPFRYVLDPAREDARVRADAAASAFARSRREADFALRDLAAVSVRARAIVARAAAFGFRDSVATGGSVVLADRERCLIALARGRVKLAGAADRAIAASERLRAIYHTEIQRQRTFDLHRHRAIQRYRLDVDLAESGENDESNARAHEARKRVARTASA